MTNNSSVGVPNGENGAAADVENAPRKNWKKYAIIGGVLAVAVIVAIVVAVTVPSGTDDSKKTGGFGLKEALSSDYVPTSFNGSWGSGNGLLYYNYQGDIVIADTDSRHENILIPHDTVGIKGAAGFAMSADNEYIMLRFEHEPRFRHSHDSHYVAIDIRTKSQYNISITGDLTELQILVWAPHGNALVFVQNNNLFFKESVLGAPIEITSVNDTRIYHGVCDWIYEEEILSTNKAIWFSPSGTLVSYIQFNDTAVQRMHLPVFGEPGTIESQYPKSRELDYPKTGTTNPTVRLFTVDLAKTTSAKVVQYETLAPTRLRDEEHIITSVAWRNGQNFVSMWTNRVQNYSVIQTCNEAACRDVLELWQDDGWLEPNQHFLFNGDGSQMALLISTTVTTMFRNLSPNNYMHIHVISFDGTPPLVITSGLFNVQSLVKWDKVVNRVFFMGNDLWTPHSSHLYAVNPDIGDVDLKQCLTCDIHSDGINQTVFTAEFSNESKHFVLSILGPSIPRMVVYSYSLGGNGLIEIKPTHTLDTNELIRDKVRHIAEPSVSNFQVRLDDVNPLFTASVKMMTPANLDLSGETKYPLMINVYGGPNLFIGTGEWSVGWGSYLASNKSVITIQVDGRSAGRRDHLSLFSGYRNLGTVEIEDQLTVAESLGKTFPFIDVDRIGIWGWSYGGYAAAMALAKDKKNVIKCAASVAPVTDWLYYDTMYTERYMGLLHENPFGYKESSLLNHVESFRNKSLLLVHGTLDDNVHYQQTMALARELEVNDVPFTQMSYPDQNHALPEVQMHLYHELNRFFGKCFDMELN